MTHIDPQEPKDVLDHATAALRDRAAESSPPPAVVAATLNALKVQDQSAPSVVRRIWAMKKIKFAATIGAIAAIVIVSICLWIVQQSSPPAFAEVVQKIKAAQTVQYRQTKVLTVNGQEQTIVMDTLLVEPEWGRMEINAPSGKIIGVANFKSNKILSLMPANKIAIVMELGDKGEEIRLMDKFKQLDIKSAKDIGPREIAGRKARGYELAKKQNDESKVVTVWVDSETQLPLEMEIREQLGVLPATVTRFTDFRWNVPVDNTLLTLTPPEGYKLQKMNFNNSPVSEKDLIEALKAAVEFNGGSFPDTFDMSGLGKAMKSLDARLKGKKEESERLKEQGPEMMFKIGRGFMFAGNKEHGSDWHYAGKGIKLGEKNRPIMWYKPAGKETYRVIDAELNVRDVAIGDLPTLESQPMIDALKMMQQTPQKVLAEMVQKVKAAQTVRYTMAEQYVDPVVGEFTGTSIDTFVGAEWRLWESESIYTRSGTANRIKSMGIVNYRLHKTLQLNPDYPGAGKVAILTETTNAPDRGNWNPIEELQIVDTREAKDLGEKVIAGQKARGYLLQKDANIETSTVWVNQDTLLPMEIERKIAASPLLQSPERVQRYTNFEWNIQVDPSLLTLTPPADYKLINLTVEPELPGEQAVIRALRVFAEVSNGQFADTFGPWDRDTQLKEQLKTHHQETEEERKATQFDGLKNSIRVSVVRQYAYNFMGKASNGIDWHYAGKGAKLGDKDRPIMWYKPAGKETYRVIDAELNVREVKAEDLPQIESITMQPPPLK